MKYKTCTDYWLDREKNRLRGDFELMYREIEDPWGCHKEALSNRNNLFAKMVFGERRYKRILDIGCGLGGLTDYFRNENRGGEIIGCDISKTAIEKACAVYPDITFKCVNILKDRIEDLGRFDLVVLSEVLWYILSGLREVFAKIYECLDKGGVCAIHQYFPSEQGFGREVIDGLTGFEAFVARHTSFVMEKKVSSQVKDGIVLLSILTKSGE